MDEVANRVTGMDKMADRMTDKTNRSQWYIGAPNGIVVCVDRLTDGCAGGRFYCRYKEDRVSFRNMDEMLEKMERFFDGINFPRATTSTRSFREERPAVSEEKERAEVMTDREMLEKHGDLGTFVIRVQHRQHNSWQGRITWLEENKSLYFRSAWEMVKLIESALNAGLSKEELEEEPHWFPEEN